MNEKLSTLKELHIEALSGQIMSRVTVKKDSDEEYAETRKIIIPKAINADGTIDISELPEEKLKVPADEKRITKVGDIVLKLSTPFDAALIDEESKDCIVPSFCAIVKYPDNIDANYLVAFLNSDYCKEQIKVMVAGATMTVLSVGKVLNIIMPCPSIEEQQQIGANYVKSQQKLKILKQIVALEIKRNNIVFRDMVKNYE